MIFFCGSVYFGQQVKKRCLFFFSITISRGTPVEKPWTRDSNTLELRTGAQFVGSVAHATLAILTIRHTNIKTDLKEMQYNDVGWIHLVQDRDRWRDLENTVIKRRVQ
jgi:hypothetical protein